MQHQQRVLYCVWGAIRAYRAQKLKQFWAKLSACWLVKFDCQRKEWRFHKTFLRIFTLLYKRFMISVILKKVLFHYVLNLICKEFLNWFLFSSFFRIFILKYSNFCLYLSLIPKFFLMWKFEILCQVIRGIEELLHGLLKLVFVEYLWHFLVFDQNRSKRNCSSSVAIIITCHLSQSYNL